jgi:hypothetical protein
LEQETATAERRLTGLVFLKAASEAEEQYWSGGRPGIPVDLPAGRSLAAETELQVGQRVLLKSVGSDQKEQRQETTVLEVLPAGYVRVVAFEFISWEQPVWPRGRIVPRESLELPGPPSSKLVEPAVAVAGLPVPLQRLAARTAAVPKDDAEKSKVVEEMQVALTLLLGVEHPQAEPLIPALRSENRAVRTTAAMALSQIRPSLPEIVPVLLETLDGESWRLGDWEPGIPAVKNYWVDFKDEPWEIQAHQWALASCGRYALPRLLTGVRYATEDQGDYRYQDRAANVRFMRRDARAVVPMLIAALHHADPRVRIAAAGGLRGLKSLAASAVPALQQAARDPSTAVQDEARQALEEILGDVAEKAKETSPADD